MIPRLIIFLITACREPGGDVAPDAAETPVDAPVEESCCRHLPDEDEVRQCVMPAPGVCGVLACRDADGSFHRVNFCGPKP